jgi:hypothetical protein
VKTLVSANGFVLVKL